MLLARVGSNAGRRHGIAYGGSSARAGFMLYAAGDFAAGFDLMRLNQEGMSGVLVASALHDGRLTGADLQSLIGDA